MYLTEYLKMRGVNANALTNAEAVELKMFEQFSMTNLEHAIKSSPLVLKSVSPWLRPFCRVRCN